MSRVNVIQIIVLMIGLVLIGKLFYLQVIDDEYAMRAENISKRVLTIKPHRGIIKDRTGEIIVQNGSSYNLVLNTPYDTSEMDVEHFCSLAGMTRTEFDSILVNTKSFRGKKLFIKNMSPAVYAKISEEIYAFPSFEIESIISRRYVRDIAAHALGYLAAINQRELENDEEGYYQRRDLIGKSGIEKRYEQMLRGEKGQEVFLINKVGKIEERFKNGAYDKPAQKGSNITLTIDAALQEYAEKLMNGKRGSLVAIEPATGEILAIVSTPGYPPSDFEDLTFKERYSALVKDPEKPLYNRAVAAQYSPGSVFKLAMALIGLEEGVINTRSRYSCNGGYRLGSMLVRCHAHAPKPDVTYSIQTSCNAFYCNLFRDLMNQSGFKNTPEAYTNWRNYLVEMGIGINLKTDLDHTRAGNLPTSDYYTKRFNTDRWTYSRIISLSIGQGELQLTPLHMANLASVIANRGYYIVPHLVKGIEGHEINPDFTKKNLSSINKVHYETVVQGMRQVYTGGTAAHCNLGGIEMCGKTGTVQNVHGKNHSVFVAFAPKDNPKIAVAAVVENAGYGSTWAAPIASLTMERYLLPDSTTTNTYLENKMMKPMVFEDYE